MTNNLEQHAVHALYRYRKSLSTTTFNARGKKVVRCEQCRLAQANCLCQHVKRSKSDSAFLLLMYDTEVLKPSNTGKLIADVVDDVHAFLWSRTEIDPNLVALINDGNYQPFVVFPAQYANDQQRVYQNEMPELNDKKPLFILLDGSWREAKKMFRKSPYLQQLPVLSIELSEQQSKQYQLRDAALSDQLATAEVASHVLAIANEPQSARHLQLWFNAFNYHYQKSVCQTNRGNPDALAQYLAFTAAHQ